MEGRGSGIHSLGGRGISCSADEACMLLSSVKCSSLRTSFSTPGKQGCCFVFPHVALQQHSKSIYASPVSAVMESSSSANI